MDKIWCELFIYWNKMRGESVKKLNFKNKDHHNGHTQGRKDNTKTSNNGPERKSGKNE